MKKAWIIIIGVCFAILLILVTVKNKSDSKSNSQKIAVTSIPDKEIEIETSPTPYSNNTTQNFKEPDINKINIIEDIKVTVTPTIKPSPTVEPTKEVKKEEINNSIKKELLEIDINTVPYKNNINTADVIVSEKHVYLYNSQLLYEIIFKMSDDASYKDSIVYYVSYDNYNSFILGEMYTIEYEQFNNGVLSVNKLKK